ncbi:hypothetical protein ACH61_02948 [Rathayibacter tanaceti]|uniref:Uncharacterized protein n=1 Tax=Rathayibacter tanaceti TaxID=1671680 RepID=A0A162F757_9MICO|nr:hypothetical protein ACH61_02948 [Rathayibacter tanaceti]
MTARPPGLRRSREPGRGPGADVDGSEHDAVKNEGRMSIPIPIRAGWRASSRILPSFLTPSASNSASNSAAQVSATEVARTIAVSVVRNRSSAAASDSSSRIDCFTASS